MSRRTFSYDLQLVFDRPDRRCAGTPRRYPPVPCYPGVGYGQVVGRGTARASVVSDGRWPHILPPGSSSSAVTRSSPISVAPNRWCSRTVWNLRTLISYVDAGCKSGRRGECARTGGSALAFRGFGLRADTYGAKSPGVGVNSARLAWLELHRMAGTWQSVPI